VSKGDTQPIFAATLGSGERHPLPRVAAKMGKAVGVEHPFSMMERGTGGEVFSAFACHHPPAAHMTRVR